MLHFQEINSVLALLHFFKLGIFWENVETLNWVFGFDITPLELLHAAGILNDSDETLSSIGGDHFAIVVHLSGLEFDESFWAHVLPSAKASHALKLLKHLIHFCSID